MDSGSNSIHELLEMFKYLKTNTGDSKTRDLSTLSFSSRNNESSNRNPLQSICILNSSNLTNSKEKQAQSKHYDTVFEKLYNEKKEIDMKRCKLQYESRRSKEQAQRSQCTFSPNIRSRFRPRTDYDSVQTCNQAFYVKNMQWLDRKDRSIRKLQCQKNQESTNGLTFTPSINKTRPAPRKEERVRENKGVSGYLQRQEKAKRNQEYTKNRQKNPYSHVWTVKQGKFSDPLYRM